MTTNTSNNSSIIQSLGDRMKSYEDTEKVIPWNYFIVRADGKTFSKYTSGFQKPFDGHFANAMQKTADDAMLFFNAQSAFVCSDEISLIFSRVCSEEEYNQIKSEGKELPVHCYNGRKEKICSLVSAKCSVLFNKHMMKELESMRTESKYKVGLLNKIEFGDAIFDARLMEFDEVHKYDLVNNIIWRSTYDCYRNCVSAYGRYLLGSSKTEGKSGKEMIEMMESADTSFKWENVSIYYKYGSISKKILVELENEKGEKYTRGKVENRSMNLINVLINEAFEMLTSKYWQNFSKF